MSETTVTWSVEFQDPSGYRCTLGLAGPDSKAVIGKTKDILAYLGQIGAQPAPDLAGTVATAATLAPPRPLGEGQHRMLIVKLKRTDETQAELFAKGHRYPDLKLFDISELATVGIDFAELPIGQELPCRFFAVWQASTKLNSEGNPYKDVCWLEPDASYLISQKAGDLANGNSHLAPHAGDPAE